MDIAGKITVNKKQYGKYLHQGKSGEIFFGKKKKARKISFSKNNYEEIAGLNDLDSNFLDNEKIEQKFSKNSLGLEIKLDQAEKKLKKIKEEIKINEILGIKNPENEKKLGKKKELIEKKIGSYREEYRKLGPAYQIADTISQISRIVGEKALDVKEIVIKFIPSARERQKVEYAKMLDKKLSNELNRPGNSDSKQIEPLLFQAEKLNKISS